jgi:RNA polymerase sigma-70 factor (ECF subfamily)
MTRQPSVRRSASSLIEIAPGEEAPVSQASRDMLLIRRFAGGDESAFNEIMQHYNSRIFNIVHNLLHNFGDAEEVVQDTFVRAHRNLIHFRGDSSLATWLCRIAVNLAHNRYWYFFRRRRHATLSLDCPVGDEGGATLADLISGDTPDPAHQSAHNDFAEMTATCLSQLEDHHREILTQRLVHDRSYDEIGAVLGIKPGTVKSRIKRARERLRFRLNEACPELAPAA